MVHKINAKKLTASTKSKTQVRHQQKMAEQQRGAERRASACLEQVTQEQIDEMGIAVMTDLNAHVRTILEAAHPEALPLVGADYFVTVQQLAAAGMTDTLKQALECCKEEREAFVAFALLSWVKQNTPAEAA